MAPRLRSSSRKRPRSLSSRSSLDSLLSPMRPSNVKPVAHKKQKLNPSGRANVPSSAEQRVTRVPSHWTQARSTITDTDEPKSPDAEVPSSRTSLSTGVHSDMEESDTNFEDSEVSEDSDSDDQPATDSDISFEVIEDEVAKHVAAASPKLPTTKRGASSKLAHRPAAIKPKVQYQKPPTTKPNYPKQAKPAPKVSGRNKDSWTYKTGIKDDLPPIHKIDAIFDDMVENAIKSTPIGKAMKYIKDDLKGRKLRVATMCSGTESPLLALDLIASGKLKYAPRFLHTY